MTISKDLLDKLVSGVKTANDFLGDKGLMKALPGRVMNRCLALS